MKYAGPLLRFGGCSDRYAYVRTIPVISTVTCVAEFSIQYSTTYCIASTVKGRSPPEIPYLIEECHDIVDYHHENALGFITVGTLLDKVTTLFSMLVKGYKLASFILIDHTSSVA